MTYNITPMEICGPVLASATTAAVLQRWGVLGAALIERRTQPVDWNPARQMIRAAVRDSRRAEARLGSLLRESSRTWFPRLCDPLSDAFDVGSNRWLENHREESYSDWLAWIIERQHPARVLSLFGLERRRIPGAKMWVEREFETPERRRPDIVVWFGDHGTLAVEVKTASEPGEDQLERYLSWLKAQPEPFPLVLLGIDPPSQELPTRCRFVPWKQVSPVLRTWASRWLSGRRGIEAALTVAFCSAVERNLLGFGRKGLDVLRAVQYLDGWMEQMRHAKSRPR